MKILNLYAGIGGNRKLWGNEHQITAIELDPEIAEIYKDLFPNDTVIITDAHKYLLENYMNYDFIWSSPPCPSHSRINLSCVRNPEYIDLKLYAEIIYLKQWYEGFYCVENVIPYYTPLIKPELELDRHYFWTNIKVSKINTKKREMIIRDTTNSSTVYGFFLKGYKIKDKRKILRNLVSPEIGLHILNSALGIKRTVINETKELFDNI